MFRKVYNELVAWKNNSDKKPLILQGARQVGKTWLMKELGKNEYATVAYFNFEQTPLLREVFRQGYDIPQLVAGLQLVARQALPATDTLLIFDEIQACPEAITSLKYFHENPEKFNIIAAGSLLGVSLHENVSFPVGKVSFLSVYPLDFHEFLYAIGESAIVDTLQSGNTRILDALAPKMIQYLRQYFYVGGMPEIVETFTSTHDYQKVRTLQEDLLEAYENDFSKHAPVAQLPRIRLVWQSIVAQLAKENAKFVYNLLRTGARAREFEQAIEWLHNTRVIYKVSRVSKPGIPLQAYTDFQDFKIFFHDIGLLCTKAGVSADILLNGNQLFTEFKGLITEQFVLQQCISAGYSPRYWRPETGISEVDFLIQANNQIIPIEVKAGENLKSKSLKVYYDNFTPNQCVRTSLSGHKNQGWMQNIPLYGLYNWLEQGCPPMPE